MEILALTDIHGDHRTLDRVRMLVSKRAFDAVFFAGDLSNDGSVSFAQEFFSPFKNLFAVPGNMDPPAIVKFIEKSGGVHNRSRKLGEWNVVGYGGSNTVGRVPFAHSDEEMARDLAKLKIDQKTILLTHMPPRGCFDMVDGENIGSLAIRKVIEEKRPFLSVSGHFHEHEGEQMLEDTIVVNVGAARDLRAAIIKIEKKEVDVEFVNL